MSDEPVCPGCNLSEPADWCWLQRLECPLDYPPRNLDVITLWRYVRDLERRLTKGDT